MALQATTRTIGFCWRLHPVEEDGWWTVDDASFISHAASRIFPLVELIQSRDRTGNVTHTTHLCSPTGTAAERPLFLRRVLCISPYNPPSRHSSLLKAVYRYFERRSQLENGGQGLVDAEQAGQKSSTVPSRESVTQMRLAHAMRRPCCFHVSQS